MEQLKAKTDKQVETIRELELELMKVGYKKTSKQATHKEAINDSKTQDLERTLNESETCIKLLENELTELQKKIHTLEAEIQANQERSQSSSDVLRLEQMLKESETCNTLLENELDSLMRKIRILEGKEEPAAPPQHYDI